MPVYPGALTLLVGPRRQAHVRAHAAQGNIGVDVILVHRMLKNQVPVVEYVLMTDVVAPGLLT